MRPPHIRVAVTGNPVSGTLVRPCREGGCFSPVYSTLPGPGFSAWVRESVRPRRARPPSRRIAAAH